MNNVLTLKKFFKKTYKVFAVIISHHIVSMLLVGVLGLAGFYMSLFVDFIVVWFAINFKGKECNG